MTSTRIADYINANQFDEPCLIVDTDIVRENYLSYAHALTVGDEILIEGTGANTTTYSAQAFNGFPPLRSVIL